MPWGQKDRPKCPKYAYSTFLIPLTWYFLVRCPPLIPPRAPMLLATLFSATIITLSLSTFLSHINPVLDFTVLKMNNVKFQPLTTALLLLPLHSAGPAKQPTPACLLLLEGLLLRGTQVLGKPPSVLRQVQVCLGTIGRVQEDTCCKANVGPSETEGTLFFQCSFLS